MELNKILNKDSFKVMGELNPGSVGTIIADPDFWADTGKLAVFFNLSKKVLHDEGCLLLWTPLCYVDRGFRFCQQYFFVETMIFVENLIHPGGKILVDKNFVILKLVKKEIAVGTYGENVLLNVFVSPRYISIKAEDKCLGYFLSLIEKYHDPEKGFILDPFSGLGSTATASSLLKKDYLAVEIDRERYERSLEFMNSVLKGNCGIQYV